MDNFETITKEDLKSELNELNEINNKNIIDNTNSLLISNNKNISDLSGVYKSNCYCRFLFVFTNDSWIHYKNVHYCLNPRL